MMNTHPRRFWLMIPAIATFIVCFNTRAEPDWVRVYTNYTPPRTEGHQMVFDITRDRVLMFGGIQVNYRNQPLYQYDGRDWVRIASSENWPSWRQNFGMAYDASRDVVVVFGGFQGGTDYLGDTWEWDGTQWEQKFPEDSPLDRVCHSMIFHEALNEVVLFGGFTEERVCTNELWSWNGVNWTFITDDQGPIGRQSCPIAYDDSRDKLVLFGGTENGWNERSDTWEWDGSNWTEIILAVKPTGKRGHAFVFDSNRNVAVLFGGADEPDGMSNRTWEYDGTNWIMINTAVSPSERADLSACYDSTRQRIVLYGGYTWSGSNNETWEYYDVQPTSTPTITPTPTETPTQTPSPSPTATPPDGISVTLDLPDNPIHSGDTFYLDVTVNQCTPEALTDIPLFCLLEVADTFWYHPTWTTYPAWETLTTLSTGETTFPIFAPFTWPAGVGSGSARFWAAVTPPDMSRILGDYDVQEVVWK